MEITVRDAGDVKVVQLDGDLNANTSPDAETQLVQLVTQGAKKILITFEKLNYISSSGLRVLLVIAQQLGGNGSGLRICCLNENVQEVFDISGFSVILNVFGTESEALDGF